MSHLWEKEKGGKKEKKKKGRREKGNRKGGKEGWKEEGIKKDWRQDKKEFFNKNENTEIDKRRQEEDIKMVKDGRKKE